MQANPKVTLIVLGILQYKTTFNAKCWNNKSIYGGAEVYSLKGIKANFKVHERNNVTQPDVY